MTCYEITSVIFQSLTFVAAITVATIYGCQLSQMRQSTKAATDAAKAAKDSVELARQNSWLEQRAWISVTTATLVHPLSEDTKPIVRLRIKNSGKTPAIKVQIIGEAYFACTPKERTETSTVNGETVIGPDCALYPEIIVDQLMNDTLINWIRINHNSIYVTGEVTYCDIFKRLHAAQFNFSLKGHNVDKRTFTACPTGNAMDGDK